MDVDDKDMVVLSAVVQAALQLMPHLRSMRDELQLEIVTCSFTIFQQLTMEDDSLVAALTPRRQQLVTGKGGLGAGL